MLRAQAHGWQTRRPRQSKDFDESGSQSARMAVMLAATATACRATKKERIRAPSAAIKDASGVPDQRASLPRDFVADFCPIRQITNLTRQVSSRTHSFDGIDCY